ncbi:MAG: AAA family ATPase [Oscillospiraceae bacterium]
MPEQPIYEYFSSIEPKEVEWLWYPYIPYGKLTILQGDPGEGKSTVMLNLIATVTNGGVFPDGTVFDRPHPVIYQCTEDNAADTVKPRLLAAGAVCEKIAYILDEDEKLTLDDSRIEDTLIRTGARLIVFDPIQSFLPQDSDMQNVGRMRSLLKKVCAIAEKHHCAVVLIGHMNKGGANNQLYRGLGSIDIAAIARSVLMSVRDRENPELRYLFQIKSSLAPEGRPVSFLMNRQQGFIWQEVCDLSIQDVIQNEPVSDNGKRSQAAVLLMEMLMEQDMPSSEIFAELEKQGISRRTVQNAKKDAHIRAYKKNNIWYWSRRS